MSQPVTVHIPIEALDTSGLPAEARTPDTTEFKQAVSELFASDLQAFGRRKIVVYRAETSSFKPSSRSADFVSSSFCFDTPPSGLASTFNVSFRPCADANFESTFV